jgi:hypothetical protein
VVAGNRAISGPEAIAGEADLFLLLAGYSFKLISYLQFFGVVCHCKRQGWKRESLLI